MGGARAAWPRPSCRHQPQPEHLVQLQELVGEGPPVVGIGRPGQAEVVVERLLLLWDELDELMGYGRHLAVGFSQAVAASSLRWRRPQPPPASLKPETP